MSGAGGSTTSGGVQQLRKVSIKQGSAPGSPQLSRRDTHSIASDVSEGSGKDGGSKHKLKIWKKMKKLGGGHKRGPGSASPGSVSPQAQAYLDDGDDLSFSDRSAANGQLESQDSVPASPAERSLGSQASSSSSESALTKTDALLHPVAGDISPMHRKSDPGSVPSQSLPAGVFRQQLRDSGSSEASEYVGTSSRPSLPNLKPQELNHLDSSASDNSLIQKPATPSSGISPLQKRLGVGPSEIRSTSPSLHIADDSTPAPAKSADHSGFPFIATITVVSGHSLAARDSNGLSDPYVKIKVGSGYAKAKTTVLYKTLSPIWNESFELGIYSRDETMVVRVYDKDIIGSDDFMGRAAVTFGKLKLDVTSEMRLDLEAPGQDIDEELGYLIVRIHLRDVESNTPIPVQRSSTSVGSVESSPAMSRRKSRIRRRSSQPGVDSSCKAKRGAMTRSFLSVTLLSGSNLAVMDENGFSDPYCKFKLGNEKWKSRIINKSLNPEWKEKFEMRMMDGGSNTLSVQVFDKDYASKDDFMGSCEVDIGTLASDVTHNITKTLVDGEGELNFLLTITGLKDPSCFDEMDPLDPDALRTPEIIQSYSLQKTAADLQDVGILMVKVIKASGLHAADFGGTSDPFVTLELGNSMVRTETVYKSLNPEWNKCFFLKVKDIHTVLDIVVSDEDRDSHEFLGRLQIPLLSIVPSESRWFALKDHKLRSLYKGQLLLQFDLVYNPVRASIRTFNPAERKYIETSEKFNRAILSANISRVYALVRTAGAFIEFINSLFLWKSKFRTSLAFFVFVVVVLVFDLWMVFAFFIGIFIYQYFRNNVGISDRPNPYELQGEDAITSDEELDEKMQDKKGLKQRLQDLYKICLTVQNGLDAVASLGERIKNTFNWTMPFQSWLALVVLTIAMFITYLIPLRYLVLLWGINKFTKRLRKPNFIPNNELLDFLSRVPSDTELVERSVVTAATLSPPKPTPANKKKKKRL